MKIIVVLPTYNEAENVEHMIEALMALPLEDPLSVMIVDDNSPDGTGEIADRLASARPEHVCVVHRPGKEGLGRAYIQGFGEAMAHGADAILQMDCDFSHSPSYIPQMIETLKTTGCDVVVGSRYTKGGRLDETWGVGRKLLSWWANSVYVRLILRTQTRDATGGFRLWRREVLERMDLSRVRANGYVFQVETVYVAEKLGFKTCEIPIYFADRTAGTSKMSFRVQVEAALRVWQVWLRHRHLTPADRLTIPDRVEATP